MRIALVSEFFYPSLGGIQEHLYFFARALVKLGHKPTIITPRIGSADDIDDWWPADLPREVYCPLGKSLPFFINGSVGRSCIGLFMGTKLRRLLTPQNFDIVHLHSPIVGVLAVLANYHSSAPMVGTFHTSFADSVNFRIYRPLLQRHIEKLEKIICVSPASLHSIQRIFKKMEAEIIPNGIDTTLFHPYDDDHSDRLTQFQDGKINILFMGRADPRNGLETLIKAFVIAKRRSRELRLIVAGGGDLMATYKTMAANLQAVDIEFLGPVRDERPQLYRTADIHVFGVQRAAFAITLLEGMASGLPIITTDFEGYEFAGTAEKHFVTTRFGDVASLADKILALASDSTKRRALGLAARERSLEFDWTKITARILNGYSEVLGLV